MCYLQETHTSCKDPEIENKKIEKIKIFKLKDDKDKDKDRRKKKWKIGFLSRHKLHYQLFNGHVIT